MTRNPQRKTPTRRLFRGGTPPDTLQTIDIGAGRGNYLMRQAFRGKTMKWEPRKYVAVDPRYDTEYLPARSNGVKVTYSNLRRVALDIQNRGVTTHPFTMQKTINWLQKNGLKTRHINVDYPYFESPSEYRNALAESTRLARALPHVLLPNGKIFMTTEQKEWVAIVQKLSKKFNLRIKIRELSTTNKRKGKTWSEAKLFDMPAPQRYWRIEIIYVPAKYRGT